VSLLCALVAGPNWQIRNHNKFSCKLLAALYARRYNIVYSILSFFFKHLRGLNYDLTHMGGVECALLYQRERIVNCLEEGNLFRELGETFRRTICTVAYLLTL
jgi:hypothetical protein